MINQHMGVAEYKQMLSPRGSKLPKTKLVSHNTVPLENVECQRFSMKLTEWVNMGLILKYSHIANESKDRMANIRNQRIGVKSGCPDFVVVLKDKIVFIEMKRQKGGVVSDDQVEWIAAILSSGGYAAICKGADEAISYLGKLI